MAEEKKNIKAPSPEKLGLFQVPVAPPTRMYGVKRFEGGYQLVEALLTDDDHILQVTRSQPDLKAVITELFRIKVGKHWNEL